MKVNIENSWNEILKEEFNKEYFQKIKNKLVEDKNSGKVIFPSGQLIFNAFNSTPFNKVKVVILGQDPYHNAGEAMGLSFSVPKNVKIPPSLKNIYKEIETDLDLPIPIHGDLTPWAQQGVLLLNASLTVISNSPNSHSKIGWYLFTDAVIQKLSTLRVNLVFMLWGNFAKQKRELIDSSKHLILEAAHPSPLAGGAFFGCKHFSQCNFYLTQFEKKVIDWRII